MKPRNNLYYIREFYRTNNLWEDFTDLKEYTFYVLYVGAEDPIGNIENDFLHKMGFKSREEE